MPIIKSAIKRMRQAEVRKARLLPYRTRMKTMYKKVQLLVGDNKIDEAKKVLPEAFKVIDTAAKKNIIHKRNASRKKSRLAKLVDPKKK